MSEKTFEIGIPVDEDGFLEMECDFCKNRFMLHADTFHYDLPHQKMRTDFEEEYVPEQFHDIFH